MYNLPSKYCLNLCKFKLISKYEKLLWLQTSFLKLLDSGSGFQRMYSKRVKNKKFQSPVYCKGSQVSCATSKKAKTKLEQCSNLTTDLVDWAISNKISHLKFSKLLKILAANGLNQLPSSSVTLFRTKEEKIKLKQVPPGVYSHFGMNAKLKELITVLSSKQLLTGNEVKLSVFIDNLTLKRATNESLWMILGSVSGISESIFVIGAYTGAGFPESSNLLLHDFVDEINTLSSKKLYVGGQTYRIRLERIICDAPAKSFVLNFRKCTGYSSCTKCDTPGEYHNNKICFPTKSTPRKNDDFHEGKMYQSDKSILVNIKNFGVVTDIPLDYMHLVCLGVLNKLLSLWLLDFELLRNVEQIRPVEVSKLKPVHKYKLWSPGNNREFLLYYGPVLIEDVISPTKYRHFLKLHSACRILCRKSEDKDLIDLARKLLDEFVEEFLVLYGLQHMSYNVHGLYHLADDCLIHGTLDNFSAFPYEKYLLQLRNSIRAARKTSYFQAILKRCQESLFEKNLGKLKRKSPYRIGEKETDQMKKENTWNRYKRLKVGNHNIIPGQIGDDSVLMKDGTLVRVLEVLRKTQKGEVFVKGVEYSSVTDYYENPVKSTLVGVHKVGTISNANKLWPIDMIERKCLKAYTQSGNEILFEMMNEEF